MNTLSELSSYVYLLGNDARTLHLYTEGENFMSIHELLQDFYELNNYMNYILEKLTI